MGCDGAQLVSFSPGEVERYTTEVSRRLRVERLRQVRRQESALARATRDDRLEALRREDAQRSAAELRAKREEQEARLAALLEVRAACQAEDGRAARAAAQRADALRAAAAREADLEARRQKDEARRAADALRDTRGRRRSELQELCAKSAARWRVRQEEERRAKEAAELGREVAETRAIERMAAQAAEVEASNCRRRAASVDRHGTVDYSKTCFHATHFLAAALGDDADGPPPVAVHCFGDFAEKARGRPCPIEATALDPARGGVVEAEVARALSPKPEPTPEQVQRAEMRGRIAEVRRAAELRDAELLAMAAERDRRDRRERTQLLAAAAAAERERACARGRASSASRREAEDPHDGAAPDGEPLRLPSAPWLGCCSDEEVETEAEAQHPSGCDGSTHPWSLAPELAQLGGAREALDRPPTTAAASSPVAGSPRPPPGPEARLRESGASSVGAGVAGCHPQSVVGGSGHAGGVGREPDTAGDVAGMPREVVPQQSPARSAYPWGIEEWCNLGDGWDLPGARARMSPSPSIARSGGGTERRGGVSSRSERPDSMGRLEQLLADTEALLRVTADAVPTEAARGAGARAAAIVSPTCGEASPGCGTARCSLGGFSAMAAATTLLGGHVDELSTRLDDICSELGVFAQDSSLEPPHAPPRTRLVAWA